MMGVDGDVLLLILLALCAVGLLCWNLYHGFLWLGEFSARRESERGRGEETKDSQVIQLEVIEWDVEEVKDSAHTTTVVKKTKTNEPPYTPSLEVIVSDEHETPEGTAYTKRIRERWGGQELHARMSELRGILSQRPNEESYHALRCALDFWPIEEGRAEGIRYAAQHLGASSDSGPSEGEVDEVGRVLERYELLLEGIPTKDT